MGLKGIQTVPPPEKCKIFVIISSFMSCFKQQELFGFEVKGGGGARRGGMGEFLFLFCFLCGLQKASPDDENRGILPASLIPWLAGIINCPHLGCILAL